MLLRNVKLRLQKTIMQVNTDMFLRSLVEGSTDAIMVAEAKTGIIAYANPASGSLFECDPAELIGVHQSKLHPPEELLDIIRKFQEFTFAEKFKEVTAHILTKKGKKKRVLISSANSFVNNDVKYLSAYFKDISHVEKLQEISYAQSHLVRRPLCNILAISKMLCENDFLEENMVVDLAKKIFVEATELDQCIKLVVEKTN